jgi:hypothetical protein
VPQDAAFDCPSLLRIELGKIGGGHTTIAKSEIGRRNANDTKFIVPAQAVAARGRPNAPGRHRRYRDI